VLLGPSWNWLSSFVILFVGFANVHGQSATSAGRSHSADFFVGGSIARSSGALDGYQSGSCRLDGEIQFGVLAGRRLRGPLFVEAMLTGHFDHPADCIRRSEPRGLEWTETTVEGDVVGYPYATTAGRIVFEPGEDDSLFRLRLLAGVGWIWAASVPYVDYGAGVSVGGKATRFVLSVASKWLTTTYDLRHRTFRMPLPPSRDTVLVSDVSEHRVVREHPVMIGIGVQHFFGRTATR
jgi:hypothetical protein